MKTETVRRIIYASFIAWTALSSLFCGTILLLWPRSYFVCDAVGRRQLRLTDEGSMVMDYYGTSKRGCITLGKRKIDRHRLMIGSAGWTYQRTKPSPGSGWPAAATGDRINFSFAGIHVLDGEWQHTSESIVISAVGFPYWLIALATGVGPMLYLRGLQKRRRQAWRAANNRCLGCGYDVRGISGPCPECGVGQMTQMGGKQDDPGLL
jgi:hypothetical protein